MRQFTVVWLKEALDDLVWIWMAATDRHAVTQATASIDRLLASDPSEAGDLVHEGLHRIIAKPLLAFYEIKLADRLVEVVRVRIAGIRDQAN